MKTKKVMSRIGWALLAFLIVSAAVQIAVVRITRGGLSPDRMLMLNYASMYLFGFPVCVWILRTIPVWKKNGEEQMKMWELLLWMVFSLGLTFAGNILTHILMSMLGVGTATGAVEDFLMEVNPWLVVPITVIFAPVMEEFLFRKLLLDRIVFIGQKPAMMISGFLFGLFHGNLEQFFYAFLVGMVLAYLYTRTGRLKYCVICHMFVNFCGGVIPMAIARNTGVFSYGAFLFSVFSMLLLIGLAWLQISCLAASVAAWILYIRKLPLFGQLPSGYDEDEKQFCWKDFFLTPGIVLLIVVEAFSFIQVF